MTREKKPTRKGSTPIVVRVTPEEKQAIDASAKQSGLSTSAYLRQLGLGYQPKSMTDYDQVIELAKINGDLGRLGGLLKLWLTDDVRTAYFGAATIRATLARIEDSQREMINVMAKVMHPRTER